MTMTEPLSRRAMIKILMGGAVTGVDQARDFKI